jgi:autotransporter-associated beta strand protein
VGSRNDRGRLRLLLASSSVAALLVGGGSSAVAACYSGAFPFINNGAQTCISVANTSFSGNVINSSSGIITAGAAAPTETGISVSNSTITGAIVNHGTIAATAAASGSGIHVFNNALVTGGITNTNAISAGGNGIFVGGDANASGNGASASIAMSNFSGGISNTGTISAGGNGIFFGGNANAFGTGASAAVTVSNFSGNISNASTISAGGNGIFVGGEANASGSGARASITISTFSGSIINGGQIVAAGNGIFVGDGGYYSTGASGSAAISIFAGGISNSGTISAGGSFGIKVTAVGTFGTSSAGGISNGGMVSANDTGIYVSFVSTFVGGITNNGTILVGSEGIWVNTVSIFGGGITNSGTISAAIWGGIQVNFVSTFAGGITNSGKISAGTDGIFVAGVSTFAGGISNSPSGAIAANTAGIYVAAVSTFLGGITNAGSISAGGKGIVVGGATSAVLAPIAALSSFVGGITNSGRISANSNGIYVTSVSTFSGDINNSGTISAGGTGIRVLNVSTLIGGITNTGTITGSVGIAVTNSGVVSVFDSGLIDGTSGIAVDLSQTGPGNTFTVGPGYTIVGNVVGSGSDTFQLGGSGSGSFNLSSIGSGQQYQGFSAFNVISGTWTATGTFAPADAWTVAGGTLTITGSLGNAGGVTLSGGTIVIGSNDALGAGTLTMDAGTTLSFLNSGNFTVANAITIAGDTSFTSPAGTTQTISGAISDGASAGTLNMDGVGTLILSGTSNYTGPTDVSAGILDVTGALGQTAVTVGSGATLQGTGSIGGAVTLNNGATLTPGSGAPGTLTVGSLTLNAGSDLSYQLGAPNVVGGNSNDLITVNGNLAVNGGTLFVANSGAFGPGVYELIGYHGTLGGSGQLAIGSLPDGLTGVIQTGSSGQIDLVVSGPSALTQFWDGAVTTGNGAIAGGSGTWNNTSANWTTPNGALNASWQGGFAVFEGTAGTVTVGEPVSYQELQFSTTGYTIAATGTGTLTPTGVAPVIVDPGLTATISAPISGTGGLELTGLGTLVLSGNNSYSGGTLLTAGTLQVTNNNAVGTGPVTFAGGIFQAGASGLSFSNAFVIGASAATIDTQANTLTLSGPISDGADASGALTKIGSGTLVLSEVNSYSGGTVIDAGTLQMFGAGTLGAASGTTTINTGATLDLGGTTQTQAAVNLAGGTIQNGALNGAVNSTGGTINSLGGTASVTATAGTTIVEGTNGYTGATIIAGGTFDVVGTITDTSGVDVEAGGVLTGTGKVDPPTTNIGDNATLVAGNAGAPGTSMTIPGSLSFASGALYVVYLNTTTSTFTTVTGSAALNGTVQANFAPGTYGARQYTILTATGGVTGTFATLTPINFTGTVSLSYDADDAFLNVGPGFVILPLPAGGTANQRAVVTGINNAITSGDTIPANIQSWDNLSGPAYLNALTQTDGEDATSAERGAFDLMNEFLGLMLDPFVDGRSGAAGSAALGFAPDQQQASVPPDIALAYAAALKTPQQTFDQRWSTWASGFGGSATANGDPATGSNNVTTSTYGYAGGVDYRWSPDTVLGFSLAGGGTNWNLAQSLGSGRSDAFLAGVYGVTHEGPAYLAGALAFANNWFSTKRTAFAGDLLTADFQGQSYSARLEGGYRFAVPMYRHFFGVTPYAALQAQDFHTPAYSETDLNGGALGLVYNAMNGTDTRGELGSRFDGLVALNGMPLILRAKLAWAHDWVSNPSLNASFASLPGSSFTVNGAPIPHDSALASAGGQLFLTANWSLLAKFDGEFAPGAQTYAGSGTLRYTW